MTLDQQLQVFRWIGALALAAFVMLCAMTWVARQRHPDRVRKMGRIPIGLDLLKWLLGLLTFWR